MSPLRLTRISNLPQAIEGCKAYCVDYREWRSRRRFIANEIDGPGRFIDLGCGSGFLIACLEMWSRHGLEPFGIDHDPDSITLARTLARSIFSSAPTQFLCADVSTFVTELPFEFPCEFDYVFWNAPNSWATNCKASFLLKAFARVAIGGKLIVAMYEENKRGQSESERQIEKANLQSKWNELSSLGVGLDRVVWNPEGTNHSVGIKIRRATPALSKLWPPMFGVPQASWTVARTARPCGRI